MAFFDQNVNEENNKEESTIVEEEKSVFAEEEAPAEDEELEVNKKNRVAYESLMEESKTKLDSYYDKNNIFVKLILFLLLIFIVCGLIYYVLLYLGAR